MTGSELILKLEQIIDVTKVKNADSILALLEKEQYNKALFLACQSCFPGDRITLSLIKFIISQRRYLDLNLNATRLGLSLLFLAAVNQNVELYMELNSFGAHDTNAQQLMFTYIRQTREKLKPFYKKEFSKVYEKLVKDFDDESKLPRKKAISEGLNAQYDFNRILYILNIINFLQTYQIFSNQFSKLPKNLTVEEEQFIKNEQMTKNRILLEKLCLTIQNLSSDLQNKYSKSFSPAPFTWITFEHLGGLIIEPSEEKSAFIPVTDMGEILSAEDESLEQALSRIESAHLFLKECNDLQEIIEEAIVDIIRTDLTALKIFFTAVGNSIAHPNNNQSLTVSLPNSKAITSYTNDLHHLVKLINLVNFTDKFNESTPSRNLQTGLITNAFDSSNRYQSRFNLSTKLGRHAAIRLLQAIGEIITGKNFSHFLCELDPSIDWRSFIIIRDAITHQDEKDNKYKIDNFLDNEKLLRQIMAEEFPYFWKKLVDLLSLREKRIGGYKYNPQTYWTSIVNLEANSKVEATEETLPNQGKVTAEGERKVSETEEKAFLDVFTKYASAEMVKECRSILNGTTRANKQQVGKILQILPKKELGEDYKFLSGILVKASSKASTTEEERNRKRLEEKQASEKRELERKAKFKGLDQLRAFAEYLEQPAQEQNMINPLLRIDATIEALMNIKEFLEEDGYILDAYPHETAKAWDQYHESRHQLILSARLASNYELNDAIEYNLGQCLQHLDTIRNFRCVATLSFMTESYYAELRSRRNYLEHGDALLDNQNEVWTQFDFRQQLIGPMIIQLIFQLLPELIKIKEEMKLKKLYGHQAHQHPLVSEKEAQEWSEVFRRTYQNQRFFSKDPTVEENTTMEREYGYY